MKIMIAHAFDLKCDTFCVVIGIAIITLQKRNSTLFPLPGLSVDRKVVVIFFVGWPEAGEDVRSKTFVFVFGTCVLFDRGSEAVPYQIKDQL